MDETFKVATYGVIHNGEIVHEVVWGRPRRVCHNTLSLAMPELDPTAYALSKALQKAQSLGLIS